MTLAYQLNTCAIDQLAIEVKMKFKTDKMKNIWETSLLNLMTYSMKVIAATLLIKLLLNRTMR